MQPLGPHWEEDPFDFVGNEADAPAAVPLTFHLHVELLLVALCLAGIHSTVFALSQLHSQSPGGPVSLNLVLFAFFDLSSIPEPLDYGCFRRY